MPTAVLEPIRLRESGVSAGGQVMANKPENFEVIQSFCELKISSPVPKKATVSHALEVVLPSQDSMPISGRTDKQQ